MGRRVSEDQITRDITMAWNIANWSGPGKKLPDLKAVIRRVKSQSKQQSVEEQRHAMYQIGAVLGIPVKRMRLVIKDERPA